MNTQSTIPTRRTVVRLWFFKNDSIAALRPFGMVVEGSTPSEVGAFSLRMRQKFFSPCKFLPHPRVVERNTHTCVKRLRARCMKRRDTAFYLGFGGVVFPVLFQPIHMGAGSPEKKGRECSVRGSSRSADKKGREGSVRGSAGGGKRHNHGHSNILGSAQLDPDSDVPMQQQLVGILKANAVRVIDLFRAWDENGDQRVSKKEFAHGFEALGVPRERMGDVIAFLRSLTRRRRNDRLRAGEAATGEAGTCWRLRSPRKRHEVRDTQVVGEQQPLPWCADRPHIGRAVVHAARSSSRHSVRVIDWFRSMDHDQRVSRGFRHALRPRHLRADGRVINSLRPSMDKSGALDMKELDRSLRRYRHNRRRRAQLNPVRERAPPLECNVRRTALAETAGCWGWGIVVVARSQSVAACAAQSGRYVWFASRCQTYQLSAAGLMALVAPSQRFWRRRCRC